jgi:hypothetical protein
MSVAKQNMIFFRNWPGKFIYMNLIYIYIYIYIYNLMCIYNVYHRDSSLFKPHIYNPIFKAFTNTCDFNIKH